MSTTGLKLSPKHGLNPTISVCFWCGEDKKEIALLGRMQGEHAEDDAEANLYSIIDYEPCPDCMAKMNSGFTVVEVTDLPNETTEIPIQAGVYPTGRFVVINRDIVTKIFRNVSDDCNKCFLHTTVFEKLFDMESDAPT